MRRCVGQERPGGQRADFVFDQLDPIRVRQVGFGNRDQAGFEVQQPQDFQMLARLWLDRIVRGHDQHCQVHARRAGQHVAHKPLVSRHIDDPQPVLAQIQVGESQLDRDAPFLLFGQAVRIDARQRANQCRLAMVDMARGAQDQVDGHIGFINKSSMPLRLAKKLGHRKEENAISMILPP